jgi:hypothetical protein
MSFIFQIKIIDTWITVDQKDIKDGYLFRVLNNGIPMLLEDGKTEIIYKSVKGNLARGL